jgi:uncharacterized protein (TIGR02453 family)
MPFAGFPKEGLAFLRELASHNEREWFEEHRKAWDEGIVPAMLSLCTELQSRVADAMPALSCAPRIGGSLYRLNRDTRFSRDKSPYKTHAAAILWDGPDKHESPGVYLHVSPSEIIFAGGVWIFEQEGQLDRFRKRVLQEKSGERLDEALAVAKKAGLLPGAHEKLARVPRGLPQEHPREELLKHKGLVVSRTHKPGAWVSTPELLDKAETAARAYAPLHAWLREEVMGAK